MKSGKNILDSLLPWCENEFQNVLDTSDIKVLGRFSRRNQCSILKHDDVLFFIIRFSINTVDPKTHKNEKLKTKKQESEDRCLTTH